MQGKKIALFFGMIILVLGTLDAFLTPLGAGFDEDTHIARIWEMAYGVMVPNQFFSKAGYPLTFNQISYRQQKILPVLSFAEWRNQFNINIDWKKDFKYETRSIYFPTLYLPQAAIMWLFELKIKIPIAYVYYLIRLSYLVTYALIIYLAVRIIPSGKWILGVLAVSPMTMIQASIVSPDGINNGMGFLFIAWIFYLASQEKPTLSRVELVISGLLVLSMCTLKINSIPLLLLLFFIPRKKFGSLARFIGFIAFTLISILVIYVGWNLLASSQLNVIAPTGIDPIEQLKALFLDPFHFIRLLASTVLGYSYNYYIQWVGVTGYNYWFLPGFVYWLYPVLLAVVVLAEKAFIFEGVKQRLLMAAVFLLVLLATYTIFYLTETLPDATIIGGIQGRYFLTGIPLLLLAFLPKKPLLKYVSIWAPSAAMLVAMICTVTLFLVYYVTCGSSYYTPGLCYRPIYKNWSPQTSLAAQISGSSYVKQTFTPECNNLVKIRVWIAQGADNPREAITASIIDAATQQTLLSFTILRAAIPSSGWLTLDFPVITQSEWKDYILEVKPANPEIGQAVALAYSSTDEYPSQTLVFSGNTLDGDLLLQYGCVAGLQQAFERQKP